MSALATVAAAVLAALGRHPLRRLVARRAVRPPAAGGTAEAVVGARVGRLLADQAPVFRIAQCREDYCGAFRVVYEAYLEKGLTRPNLFQMRVTPYQLLPTTEVLVAVRQGEVIATLSLVRDGLLGLPMESVYPEEVAALRDRDLRLAEVSCLADRRHVRGDSGASFRAYHPPATAMRLMSLMAQCALARGVNCLLIAVHPRHARFYQRFTAFEPIGGVRTYHAVCDRPAVAMALDIDRAPIDHPELYRRFFGLPLPAESLAPRPILPKLQKEFAAIVAATYDGPIVAQLAWLGT